MEHYLDNSATTVASLAAAKKAFEMMTENYANPSSLHYRGMLAEQELEKARKAVAKQLFAQTDEIIFTSGGTEANNFSALHMQKNAEVLRLLRLPLSTAVLWSLAKDLSKRALRLHM